MGLDMFLTAKRFLWHDEEKLKKAITKAFPDTPGDPRRVEVEAAYWRKANHIHAWFVEHVQDGKDDRGDYDVSREQMEALRQVCENVLANRDLAPSLLPTRAGFFFGSTDFDDSYFEDLEYTVKRLDILLARKDDKWHYEYHSSW